MNVTHRLNAKIVAPHLAAVRRERHDAAMKKLLEGDTLAQQIKTLSLQDCVFGTNQIAAIREAIQKRVKTREVSTALKRVAKSATRAGAVTADGRSIPITLSDDTDPRDVDTLRRAGILK